MKTPSMNLKQIVDTITLYANEIDCISNKNGYIGSHNIVGMLNVEDDNGNCYEVIDINLEYMFGCGCPRDVTLIIKKLDDI